jgi:hypothetical protein
MGSWWKCVLGGLNIFTHLLLCNIVDGFALIGAVQTSPGASPLCIQWSLDHLPAQKPSKQLNRALMDKYPNAFFILVHSLTSVHQ